MDGASREAASTSGVGWWGSVCRSLVVVVAVLSVAHVLVRTSTYGAAISQDSTHHLSAAMSLLQGEGLVTFRGHPHVLFPPFYSLLLAAGGLFGVDMLEAGRWVNAVAFGLTVLLAGLWLRRNLESSIAGWLALGVCVVVGLSLPLNDSASRVLTESVFVLFVLLALMQLGSFLRAEGRWTPLLLAAGLSGLAVQTRYAGLALILAGILVLLVRRGAALTDRLRHVAAFGAISGIPLAALIARNWLVSGTLTGPRVGTGQSLSESLSQVARVIGAWAVPPGAPGWSVWLLWPMAGLLALVGLSAVLGEANSRQILTLTSRPAYDDDRDSKGAPLRDRSVRAPALPFVTFVAVYLVFIVATVPLTVPFPIGNRFLVPLYVPLLVVAALLLDRFPLIDAVPRVAVARRIVVSVVLVGAFTHVVVAAQTNLAVTTRALEAGYVGRTYNASGWEDSETLEYFRIRRIKGRTYSNNAFAVWLADMTAAPGTHDRVLALAQGSDLPGLKKGIEGGSGEATIVWFKSPRQAERHDFSDVDIRALPGVRIVAELSDGVIFRVAMGRRSPGTS